MEDSLERGLESLITHQTFVFKHACIIGKGSYGSVYSVDKPGIAVKITRNSNGIDGSMLREIVTLRKLNHKNIISLLDVLIGEKCIGIVMPKASKTLEQYRDEKWCSSVILNTRNCVNPQTLVEFKSIIRQIASGIAYLHSVDVLHGDLKSTNVLLYDNTNNTNTDRYQVVLIDYGLASSAGCYEPTKCKHLFTIWYRPPELLLGGKYTTQGDIWALGCMATELLTGRPPFITIEKDEHPEYSMLFLIFKRLGLPDEKSWPEALLLPNWNLDMFQGIEHAKKAYHYENQLLSIPEMSTNSALVVKYAYTIGRDRIPLPFDQQQFLSRMLALDPTTRATTEDILTDEWFGTNSSTSSTSSTNSNTSTASNSNSINILRRDYRPITKKVSSFDSLLLTQINIWIFSLCNDSDFKGRCTNLATNLFERYVCLYSIEKEKLVFLATCCVRISLILMGTNPTIKNISSMSSLDQDELAKMEEKLVYNLWEYFGCSTLYDMINYYTKDTSLELKETAETLGRLATMLGEHSLVDTNKEDRIQTSKDYSLQEMLAIVCIMLACKACNKKFYLQKQAREIGLENLVMIIIWFGETLQTVLNTIDDTYRVKMLSSRLESSLNLAGCVLNIPVLMQYVDAKQLVLT